LRKIGPDPLRRDFFATIGQEEPFQLQRLSDR